MRLRTPRSGPTRRRQVGAQRLRARGTASVGHDQVCTKRLSSAHLLHPVEPAAHSAGRGGHACCRVKPPPCTAQCGGCRGSRPARQRRAWPQPHEVADTGQFLGAPSTSRWFSVFEPAARASVVFDQVCQRGSVGLARPTRWSRPHIVRKGKKCLQSREVRPPAQHKCCACGGVCRVRVLGPLRGARGTADRSV